MIWYDMVMIWYILYYIILYYIILYYIITILWDHCHICGPSLTETSLCGAYLYYVWLASGGTQPSALYKCGRSTNPTPLLYRTEAISSRATQITSLHIATILHSASFTILRPCIGATTLRRMEKWLWNIAPCILNLGTRWWWETVPLCPLDKLLGGPQAGPRAVQNGHISACTRKRTQIPWASSL